jgi:hypothetical protein
MSERFLKNWIAGCFIFSQVITFVSLIVINGLGGFNERHGEVETIGMLILPMFTIYTTTIVKSSIAERGVATKLPSRKVSAFFASLALSVIVIYALLIPGLVWCRGTNFLINRFEDLKIYLGLAQTGFAVYLGLIIDALYKRKRD